MKPYGQRDKLQDNFVDNHPPKGYVNWWEFNTENVNKKRARRKAKNKIENELTDD